MTAQEIITIVQAHLDGHKIECRIAMSLQHDIIQQQPIYDQVIAHLESYRRFNQSIIYDRELCGIILREIADHIDRNEYPLLDGYPTFK